MKLRPYSKDGVLSCHTVYIFNKSFCFYFPDCVFNLFLLMIYTVVDNRNLNL